MRGELMSIRDMSNEDLLSFWQLIGWAGLTAEGETLEVCERQALMFGREAVRRGIA